MKVYTSYFANMKQLEDSNVYPVAICNKVPSFFKGPNIESVAPNNSILYEYKKSAQDSSAQEHYKERYINEVLCAYRFHPEYFIDLLAFFSLQEDNKDIALVCYERPEDFCHRHILAEWFNERIPNLNIIEFPNFPNKQEKKQKTSDISFEINTLF